MFEDQLEKKSANKTPKQGQESEGNVAMEVTKVVWERSPSTAS